VTPEEQQIHEQISLIWKRIDIFLKKYNNCLLLLDFTTLYQFENNKTKIKSIYQCKIHNYQNLFLNFLNDNGNSFISRDETGSPILHDSQEDVNIELLDNPTENIYNSEDASETKIVQIETWHKFVEQEKIAGGCWTLFEDFFEYEDTKEKIVVGIYILLKNKMAANEKIINDFISLEVYKFLYGRGRQYSIKEYKEKFKQFEKFKTKTMFSLTTHSLKTHLNTNILKEVNFFSDELEPYPELKEQYDKYVKKEVYTLFRLTDILSLVDKIHDKEKFTDTAKGGTLLSESIVHYNLKEHLDEFNRRKNLERAELDIKICSTVNLESFILPINIYALFLGKDLIELFFNTIFENIVAYGKPESGYRNLVIEIKQNQIIFSNRTLNKRTQVDETRLTGNYGLFKKLFEDTDSGNFSIHLQTDYEFKIIISYGK
jgi:hypothetical protein